MSEESEIHIRVQQLVGRKRITKIDGVTESKRTTTLKALRKTLSCGGSLNKDGSIQLQGDYTETIAKKLENILDGCKVVIHGKRQ